MYRSLLIPVIFFVSCTTVTVQTENNFELVELPDHSLVYLNHNSSLKYDEDFDRKMELKGEAFFSVAPAASPFIVTTELGEISVTGTEFNVVADDEVFDVEVEEGSVAVSTKGAEKNLTQGQRAIYKKGAKSLKAVKAGYHYKKWIKELEVTFREMGKDLKKAGKAVGRESEDVSKDIKKEAKKLKSKLKDL